ncbi:hypothetical protein [Fluviispira sanaruensis]|uniref:SH3 domain-containing protein n=1 Tax=Fluviispira sanaruensis TaxID=2493639 RepID=A0A4P2VY25_FLUSA|nr:hypothetical protein [Fluviispira sanaruensis]BBH53952.1 hypothetical protein JCM31447_24050 [Fluviispira sanaruensis]
MKVVKIALSLLAVYGQSFAYSAPVIFMPPYERYKILNAETKYILCVNAQDNSSYFWARNTSGSYAYVRGKIHNEITGINKLGTPIFTDLFKVNVIINAKEILNICPENYYMQPADSNSKKLYQMLFISESNDYYIFPGQEEVSDKKSNNSNLDLLAGMAIG